MVYQILRSYILYLQLLFRGEGEKPRDRFEKKSYKWCKNVFFSGLIDQDTQTVKFEKELE